MKIEHSHIKDIFRTAFAPLSCECEVMHDGSLTIKIFDKESGRVDLIVAGINLHGIYSIRQISDLVSEIRAELITVNQNFIIR